MSALQGCHLFHHPKALPRPLNHPSLRVPQWWHPLRPPPLGPLRRGQRGYPPRHRLPHLLPVPHPPTRPECPLHPRRKTPPLEHCRPRRSARHQLLYREQFRPAQPRKARPEYPPTRRPLPHLQARLPPNPPEYRPRHHPAQRHQEPPRRGRRACRRLPCPAQLHLARPRPVLQAHPLCRRPHRLSREMPRPGPPKCQPQHPRFLPRQAQRLPKHQAHRPLHYPGLHPPERIRPNRQAHRRRHLLPPHPLAPRRRAPSGRQPICLPLPLL